jgi:CRP-like cAMP-binding protein
MVLVLDGSLTAPGSRIAVRGALVGAHAMLQQAPHVFSWRTSSEATLGFISRSLTRALMAGSPAFATAVAVSLARELSVAHAETAHSSRDRRRVGIARSIVRHRSRICGAS